MKLLQNTAGNFLSLTPQEAKAFAEKLLKAAEESLTVEAGRGAGFVQTIVIREDRKATCSGYGALDTIFVGISKTWLDIHPSLEADLQPRESHIMHLRREDINVGLKDGSIHFGGARER
jgi:hypothetical protein